MWSEGRIKGCKMWAEETGEELDGYFYQVRGYGSLMVHGLDPLGRPWLKFVNEFGETIGERWRCGYVWSDELGRWCFADWQTGEICWWEDVPRLGLELVATSIRELQTPLNARFFEIMAGMGWE